jgi:hypothetical protein
MRNLPVLLQKTPRRDDKNVVSTCFYAFFYRFLFFYLFDNQAKENFLKKK